MKTIANLQKCPTVAELDNLCNALNDGRIALRDLKSQVASLLDNQQVQEICLIMCQLCVDNPGYYRDERCVDLWTDAQNVYLARIECFWLSRPKIKILLMTP